jgi:uncharacterized protein YdeI (YjbR/CyaY-like superfamily)
MSVDLGKTLYLTERKKWRSWLAKNHDKEKEIWLIYYRKSSGKPRLSYDDAVEEALCYGWIDSIQKGIDDEKFAQRFTPRKLNSSFSEANRERVRRLIGEGKMTRAGLIAISASFDAATDQEQEWRVAPDILKAIRADKLAWKNFQSLPEDYKRVRIGFVESRRRHGDEMFQRSLQHFVKMTAKNKRFGIMK